MPELDAYCRIVAHAGAPGGCRSLPEHGACRSMPEHTGAALMPELAGAGLMLEQTAGARRMPERAGAARMPELTGAAWMPELAGAGLMPAQTAGARRTPERAGAAPMPELAGARRMPEQLVGMPVVGLMPGLAGATDLPEHARSADSPDQRTPFTGRPAGQEPRRAGLADLLTGWLASQPTRASHRAGQPAYCLAGWLLGWHDWLASWPAGRGLLAPARAVDPTAGSQPGWLAVPPAGRLTGRRAR